MFQDKNYKNSDFGHFQAFCSNKITTKTSNGHMIFCFQDRVLKFCMKAYGTNLNPRLRGIFDILTFSFFGTVSSTDSSEEDDKRFVCEKRIIKEWHQKQITKYQQICDH